MGWKADALRLALLGWFPFGNLARSIKRRIFGYPPDVDNLDHTLENLDEMLGAVEKAGRSFVDATVLEIGSGWFPTIPIMLSAHGARNIYLSDLTPRMDRMTFAATLEYLKPRLKAFPGSAKKTTLEEFSLEYLAPFRPDQIPDGSLDFVISRTVLEHIPIDDLQEILTQLRPKLSANGLMVHCIDHSDHFEHRDKSISKINFLTWSEKRHKVVNWLTKGGENRLRHHEYRRLFAQTGYDVIFESGQPHPPTLEWARKLPMQDRFAGMTPEQISILLSIFILSPRADRVPAAVTAETDARLQTDMRNDQLR